MTDAPSNTARPPDWASAWRRESRSAKATQAWARAIGQDVACGTVIGLVGPMGAGKTTFVQGLAAGFGVAHLADVTSPTYTLVNIYPGPHGALTHLDLYRLTDIDSATGLGLEEVLGERGGLIVVEWADHLPELMPPDTVWLRLTCTSPKHRTLEGLGLAAPAKRRP